MISLVFLLMIALSHESAGTLFDEEDIGDLVANCTCGTNGPPLYITKTKCCQFLGDCGSDDNDDVIGDICCEAFLNCTTCLHNHPKCLACPPRKTGKFCNETDVVLESVLKKSKLNAEQVWSANRPRFWIDKEQKASRRNKRRTLSMDKSKGKSKHIKNNSKYVPMSSWVQECSKTWELKTDDTPKRPNFMPMVKEHRAHYINNLDDDKKPFIMWYKDCIKRYIYQPYNIRLNPDGRPFPGSKLRIDNSSEEYESNNGTKTFRNVDGQKWSVGCSKRAAVHKYLPHINRPKGLNILPVEKLYREYFVDYTDDDENPRLDWTLECMKHFTFVRDKTLRKLIYPKPIFFHINPYNQDLAMECSKRSKFELTNNEGKTNSSGKKNKKSKYVAMQNTTLSCLKHELIGFINDENLFPKNYTIQRYHDSSFNPPMSSITKCVKQWIRKSEDFINKPNGPIDDSSNVHVKWSTECTKYRAPIKKSIFPETDSRLYYVMSQDSKMTVTYCTRTLVYESKVVSNQSNATNKTNVRGGKKKRAHEEWIESCLDEVPSYIPDDDEYEEIEENVTEQPIYENSPPGNFSGETNSSLSAIRHKRQTNTCEFPHYLPHARLNCVEHSTYVRCNQTCVWGYTLSEGRSQTIQCYFKDNIWTPNPFEACKVVILCKIQMVKPGDFFCYDNMVDSPTYCNITCQEFEDYPAVPFTKYECDEGGNWHPDLPFCAIDKTLKSTPKFYKRRE